MQFLIPPDIPNAIDLGAKSAGIPLAGTMIWDALVLDHLTEGDLATVGGFTPAVVGLAAFPNPFRAGTQIAFELSERGPVQVQVLDIQGRLVRNLLRTELDAGRHTIPWDGRSESGRSTGSGIYFFQLRHPGGVEGKKVVRVQ